MLSIGKPSLILLIMRRELNLMVYPVMLIPLYNEKTLCINLINIAIVCHVAISIQLI